MIELGEAEERHQDHHRGRERAQAAQARRGAARARGAALGRGRRLRHLPRSACRRRRYREPGLGQHAHAHVYALGRAAWPQGRVDRGDRRRRGRHQVGDRADQGPQRLWLAQERAWRAPAGAHLAVRLQCAAAYLVRQRQRLSGDRRPHQGRHQGGGRAHRHDARQRRRRPARQQDRVGDPPHAHPDQHRGVLPERPLAAQEPRAGLGHAARASSTRWS